MANITLFCFRCKRNDWSSTVAQNAWARIVTMRRAPAIRASSLLPRGHAGEFAAPKVQGPPQKIQILALPKLASGQTGPAVTPLK
jgi:hypothetical protein